MGNWEPGGIWCFLQAAWWDSLILNSYISSLSDLLDCFGVCIHTLLSFPCRYPWWHHWERPWLQADHRGNPRWWYLLLDPDLPHRCQGHQHLHYWQGMRHADHWRKAIQGGWWRSLVARKLKKKSINPCWSQLKFSVWLQPACFQATVHMEGGKLSVTFPKYHHVSEISGGKLIEVFTLYQAFSAENLMSWQGYYSQHPARILFILYFICHQGLESDNVLYERAINSKCSI